jgi:ComF family protein
VRAGIQKHSKSYISSLINLFFPHCCVVCGTPLVSGEKFLCTKCNIDLPRTHFHLQQDNPVERLFWGKVDICRATSFFYYYRGSDMRMIIHQLKYAGRKEIGRTLGRMMAAELEPSGFFEGVDLILPMPLHPKKLHDRGYNQSEWIAKGLNEVTQLPIDTTHVSRIKHVETQTHKTPFERWENVQQIFTIRKPEEWEGKHVLVVDDVLTTGATAIACMSSFKEVKDIRISFLSLAIAAK